MLPRVGHTAYGSVDRRLCVNLASTPKAMPRGFPAIGRPRSSDSYDRIGANADSGCELADEKSCKPRHDKYAEVDQAHERHFDKGDEIDLRVEDTHGPVHIPQCVQHPEH